MARGVAAAVARGVAAAVEIDAPTLCAGKVALDPEPASLPSLSVWVAVLPTSLAYACDSPRRVHPPLRLTGGFLAATFRCPAAGGEEGDGDKNGIDAEGLPGSIGVAEEGGARFREDPVGDGDLRATELPDIIAGGNTFGAPVGEREDLKPAVPSIVPCCADPKAAGSDGEGERGPCCASPNAAAKKGDGTRELACLGDLASVVTRGARGLLIPSGNGGQRIDRLC